MGYEERKSQTTVQSTTKKPTISPEHCTSERIIGISEKCGMWYAAFNYTYWTGQNKHTCKWRFKTHQEAKEYERQFFDQQNTSSDILFSSLAENYLKDM